MVFEEEKFFLLPRFKINVNSNIFATTLMPQQNPKKKTRADRGSTEDDPKVAKKANMAAAESASESETANAPSLTETKKYSTTSRYR